MGPMMKNSLIKILSNSLFILVGVLAIVSSLRSIATHEGSAHLKLDRELLALSALEKTLGVGEAIMRGAHLLSNHPKHVARSIETWIKLKAQNFLPLESLLVELPQRVPFVWRGGVYIINNGMITMLSTSEAAVYYKTNDGVFFINQQYLGIYYDQESDEIFCIDLFGDHVFLRYEDPWPNGHKNSIFSLGDQLFINSAKDAPYVGGMSLFTFNFSLKTGRYHKFSPKETDQGAYEEECASLDLTKRKDTIYAFENNICYTQLDPIPIQRLEFPQNKREQDIWSFKIRAPLKDTSKYNENNGNKEKQSKDLKTKEVFEPRDDSSGVEFYGAEREYPFQSFDMLFNEDDALKTDFQMPLAHHVIDHDAGYTVVFVSSQGKGAGINRCFISASKKTKEKWAHDLTSSKVIYDCKYTTTESDPTAIKLWRNRYLILTAAYYEDEIIEIFDLYRDQIYKLSRAKSRLKRPNDTSAHIPTPMTTFFMSPNGQTLTLLQERGGLLVYELSNELNLINKIYQPIDQFEDLKYLNDKEVLISSSLEIKHLNLLTGEVRWRVRLENSSPSDQLSGKRVTLSEDGLILAIVCGDYFRLMDPNTGISLTEPTNLPKVLKTHSELSAVDIKALSLEQLTVGKDTQVTLSFTSPNLNISLKRAPVDQILFDPKSLSHYTGIDPKQLIQLETLPNAKVPKTHFFLEDHGQ